QYQRTEEFREAKIVANRQAKRDAIDFSRYDLIARHDALRFVVLLAISQIHVKEVYFAILSDNFALAIDQDGGVIELSRQVWVVFKHTAAMNNHVVLARLLLQAFNGRSWNCLRGCVKAT